MSNKWEEATSWESTPRRGADKLARNGRLADDERQAAIAAAVEEAAPGLHRVPDPVEPAGEGALTPEERERLKLCEQGIELHDLSWFMLGKALDTVATGRLFRDTPHKLEPERCYGSIEEWAEVEKGISVSRCSQLRAAWPIGEVLMARGYDANPGQVRELVPVKNAYGLNAAVAVYVLVADSVGADKVTAARLREAVKLLPGDLQLEMDEDPDVLAKVIQGVLVGEVPPKSAVAIPPAVKRAVDARAIKLADALDRGRIPRAEVQLHLLEAFADPDDPVVFDAVLARMQKAEKEAREATR